MGLALEPTLRLNAISLENKYTKERPEGCFLVPHNTLKIVLTLTSNLSSDYPYSDSILAYVSF